MVDHWVLRWYSITCWGNSDQSLNNIKSSRLRSAAKIFISLHFANFVRSLFVTESSNWYNVGICFNSEQGTHILKKKCGILKNSAEYNNSGMEFFFFLKKMHVPSAVVILRIVLLSIQRSLFICTLKCCHYLYDHRLRASVDESCYSDTGTIRQHFKVLSPDRMVKKLMVASICALL